jgi:hypothetical protein
VWGCRGWTSSGVVNCWLFGSVVVLSTAKIVREWRLGVVYVRLGYCVALGQYTLALFNPYFGLFCCDMCDLRTVQKSACLL